MSEAINQKLKSEQYGELKEELAGISMELGDLAKNIIETAGIEDDTEDKNDGSWEDLTLDFSNYISSKKGIAESVDSNTYKLPEDLSYLSDFVECNGESCSFNQAGINALSKLIAATPEDLQNNTLRILEMAVALIRWKNENAGTQPPSAPTSTEAASENAVISENISWTNGSDLIPGLDLSKQDKIKDYLVPQKWNGSGETLGLTEPQKRAVLQAAVWHIFRGHDDLPSKPAYKDLIDGTKTFASSELEVPQPWDGDSKASEAVRYLAVLLGKGSANELKAEDFLAALNNPTLSAGTKATDEEVWSVGLALDVYDKASVLTSEDKAETINQILIAKGSNKTIKVLLPDHLEYSKLKTIQVILQELDLYGVDENGEPTTYGDNKSYIDNSPGHGTLQGLVDLFKNPKYQEAQKLVLELAGVTVEEASAPSSSMDVAEVVEDGAEAVNSPVSKKINGVEITATPPPEDRGTEWTYKNSEGSDIPQSTVGDIKIIKVNQKFYTVPTKPTNNNFNSEEITPINLSDSNLQVLEIEGNFYQVATDNNQALVTDSNDSRPLELEKLAPNSGFAVLEIGGSFYEVSTDEANSTNPGKLTKIEINNINDFPRNVFILKSPVRGIHYKVEDGAVTKVDDDEIFTTGTSASKRSFEINTDGTITEVLSSIQQAAATVAPDTETNTPTITIGDINVQIEEASQSAKENRKKLTAEVMAQLRGITLEKIHSPNDLKASLRLALLSKENQALLTAASTSGFSEHTLSEISDAIANTVWRSEGFQTELGRVSGSSENITKFKHEYAFKFTVDSDGKIQVKIIQGAEFISDIQAPEYSPDSSSIIPTDGIGVKIVKSSAVAQSESRELRRTLADWDQLWGNSQIALKIPNTVSQDASNRDVIEKSEQVNTLEFLGSGSMGKIHNLILALRQAEGDEPEPKAYDAFIAAYKTYQKNRQLMESNVSGDVNWLTWLVRKGFDRDQNKWKNPENSSKSLEGFLEYHDDIKLKKSGGSEAETITLEDAVDNLYQSVQDVLKQAQNYISAIEESLPSDGSNNIQTQAITLKTYLGVVQEKFSEDEPW